MTPTMMVIGMVVNGMIGFFLGQHQARHAIGYKIKEVQFKVDQVIRIIQLKLVTDNDHRGFHTRTQVIEWLKRTAPEVHEEFHSGANHGRKTV